MRTADHLQTIDGRLDRIEAKIDDRFGAVDARFVDVDKRFEQVDKRFEQVDKRFEEQRSHFNALHEASRSDFNNLYDFVKAQAVKTDERFDRLETELRIRFADLHTAIRALVPRASRRRPRKP